MKFTQKPIAQGAGFAGVAFLTAFICKYVPMVMVLYLLLPIGMVMLARRYRFRTALIAGIVPAAAEFLIFSPTTALDYALYLVLVGGIMSFVYAKNLKGFVRLGITYAALLAVMLVSIGVYQATTGKVFTAQIISYIRQALKASVGTTDLTDAATVQSLSKSIVAQAKLMIPSMILIMPFFGAWILVLLSDYTLIQRGYVIFPLRKLSHWFMPRSTARFLLILLIIAFISAFGNGSDNVYIVTLTNLTDFAFGIMGLSFLFWVFNRKRKRESIGVKVAILIVCAILYSIMSQILPLIGIIDVYSSLRLHIMMRDNQR